MRDHEGLASETTFLQSPAISKGEAPTLKRPSIRLGKIPSPDHDRIAQLDTRPARSIAPEAATPAEPPTKGAATSKKKRLPIQIRSALVALVAFVLLNGVVQLFSYQLADPNDARLNYYRLRRCEALGQRLDAIYLGTSHEYDSIDPMTLDTAVQQRYGASMTSCSLAMVGSTTEANYYLIKRYLEDGYTPKAVVVGLWERNFNVNGETNADFFNDISPIWRTSNLSDLPDIAWHFQYSAHTYYDAVDYVAQKTIPVYGLRYGILRKLCGPSTKDICAPPPEMAPDIAYDYTHANAKNWTNYIPPSLHMKAPYNPKTDPAYIPLGSPNVLKDFQIGGPEIGYLHKLLDLLKAHHIIPIMEISPYEETFFHWFPDPGTWPAILAFYRDVARQHNAYFADNSRFSELSYLDFFDPQHVTNVGAYKYSAYLGTKIVYPILKGLPPDPSVQVP